MSNIYNDYYILDAQIKELTAQRDAKKEEIIKEVAQTPDGKLKNDFGSFTITKLKTWVYPEYVSQMETEYKLAKLKAENNDEATYTEKESLRFTPNKD